MITISAGTVDKTSTVRTTKEGEYKIEIANNNVVISIKSDGEASGGWQGAYPVTRKAKASVPLSLIVEMAVEGLLHGEYELSSSETKRLLLAIASTLPDYSA